ncbi:MAG: DUF4097 family beta strand repeat protein [Candidatus Marinimicrobia bacterium]|nr:DUF4097 family beta strand repeat protein [Candidatus Neomarinimicrobiota bacterium]
MKKIISYLNLFIFLAASVFAQEFSRDSYNRYTGTSTYTFKSEGHGQLVMDKITGDITISGEPVDKVKITETISIRSSSKKVAKELYEKSKASVSQKTEKDELFVLVNGSQNIRKSVSFNYTIQLPLIFSLIVNTRGGDIDIGNVKGQIDITTAGGDLDLSDISGRISATTSGGDIDVLDLQGRIFLNTSGGDVEIRRIEGDLNVRTGGGDIEVDDVRGNCSVSTGGGDIELSDIDGREVYAKTNGGDVTAENIDARVDLNTLGGSIEMDRINGEVDASTSGGNIEMEDMTGSVVVWTSTGSIEGNNIFGSLDAKTQVGDIIIHKLWDKNLDDHEINLKTSRGDIELTLPKNFPGNFSARSITPNVRTHESIKSEFELNITVTPTMSRARGTAGEGLYRVELEANMGTITISMEE